MKLKLKHLRHPLRAANAAKAMAAARWDLARLAVRCERHFAGDARYALRSVSEGFAARIDDQSDDAALLDRICTAYIKAVERDQHAPAIYKATEWWELQRRWTLKPVIQALATRDFEALQRMYGNFFRDPCSAGLIVVQSMAKDHFGERIKDIDRRVYLADALYHIDYWKAQTGGGYAMRDLSGPAIGNPFGVVIDGTLLRAGAAYQHYCAHRIRCLLQPGAATVIEIGGGFGGMAYYLLRDTTSLTYIDFDVPESIALTSYYLLKAFPQLKFLLYGEEELTEETISRADVVLMPVFELAAMPEASADVVFCSHSISDLSHGAMVAYLNDIARITQDHFLYLGNSSSGKAITELVKSEYHSFRLAEMRFSGWHSHRIAGPSEIESHYRLDGS
jgi:putative sugar O-methyltransferase